MRIGEYQNIVVITISQGNYVNHWVYRADKIDPEKKHGWDSLPLYLSVLKQTILNPECHKKNNGEDYHLYYIPMGDDVNIEKAKKIALQRFSEWRQPWETLPDYVIKFVFHKKNNYPSETQIFRKDCLAYLQYDKSDYFKYYQQSVYQPLDYQKKTGELIVCWHGNILKQIVQEVFPKVKDFWKKHFKNAIFL
ncbi:MAG: hypothetical protein K2G88_11150 [Oscillospiraceae bacterium]|nr:hypothetical protein [Oscillospiraceae bacterium]